MGNDREWRIREGNRSGERRAQRGGRRGGLERRAERREESGESGESGATRFGIVVTLSAAEDQTKVDEPNLPYADNYESMLNNTKYADVRFVFEEGEPIFAHRMLLAHRCEYFRDLFGCGFKEQTEKVCVECERWGGTYLEANLRSRLKDMWKVSGGGAKMASVHTIKEWS
jgi:hypothetical protein